MSDDLSIKIWKEAETTLLKQIGAFFGYDVSNTESVITQEDLDRGEADKDDMRIVQDGMTSSNSALPNGAQIATIMSGITERSRIRRDINISRASHKRLIASSLDISFSRMLESARRGGA